MANKTKQTKQVKRGKKTTYKKPIIGGAVALVLAGALTITAGIGSSVNGKWFKNPDLKTWFDGWGKGVESVQPDNTDKPNGSGESNNPNTPQTPDYGDTDNGGALITENKDLGLQLFSAQLPREAFEANGIVSYADSAYTLTAKVKPEYAENQQVDWSLEFLNPYSTWANGKSVSDYGTLAPSSDGALTATFTCLRDFGEPLVITARSRENPNARAQCLIDYYQRVKSIGYKFVYDGAEVTPTVGSDGVYKVDYIGEDKSYTVEIIPEYTAYTLSEDFTTSISGGYSAESGYTALNSFTEISMLGGLLGGELEISDKARTWCDRIYNLVSSVANGTSTGEFGYAYNGYMNTDYNALSSTDKAHPRVKTYYNACKNNADYAAKLSAMNAYTPATYRFNGEVDVGSFEDFIASVSRCNEAGVGLLQYTISYTGVHSSCENLLNLSFTERLLNGVVSVEMSESHIKI